MKPSVDSGFLVQKGVKREWPSSLPDSQTEKKRRSKESALQRNTETGLFPPTDSIQEKEHTSMTFKSARNTYHTIEFIGKGTFGTTYKAIDSKTKQAIAIKVEAAFVGKLKVEQEIYNLIQNSGEPIVGIPKLMDHGTALGRNFIVMELLGPSLAERASSINGTFPESTVAAIGLQLLKTLKCLHQIGIVHADIKPDNVVIGLHEKASKLFVLDFGGSLIYKNTRTGTRVHEGVRIAKMGTMMFMTETAHNLQMLGPRDDLISLSYMLALLVQGSLPWADVTYESQHEKWTKIRNCKANCCPGTIFDGQPYQFVDFLAYALNLGYWDDVDYGFLARLLGEICDNQEDIYWDKITPVPFRKDLYAELPSHYTRSSNASHTSPNSPINPTTDSEADL